MRWTTVAGACTLALPLLAAGCANRPPLGAWCADLNGQGQVECDYRSFAQCQASVSGVGGFCYQNPRLAVREPRLR